MPKSGGVVGVLVLLIAVKTASSTQCDSSLHVCFHRRKGQWRQAAQV